MGKVPLSKLALCGFLLTSVWPLTAQAKTCRDSGADMSDDSYCRFMKHYVARTLSRTDQRIVDRFPPRTPGEPPIRSMALIVDVNKYPNFPEADQKLDPARVDLEKLQQFLIHQNFDEIIVLENKDASRDNINYFLETYLDKQTSLYQGRSRVLFAFSGHGSPSSTKEEPGALVLSDATGSSDHANAYPLADLTPRLKHLANKSFQFVALLGSCYSAGVIPASNRFGDNFVFPGSRGAHAISATKADDLAYAVGSGKGTLFFENLIEGVESGNADRDYSGWVQLEDQSLKRVGGGIIRLGALATYISGRLDRINPATNKPFPQLMLGNLEDGENWGGAFFFLGPPKQDLQLAGQPPEPKPPIQVCVVVNGLQQCTLEQSSTAEQPVNNTGSSFTGHPDVVAFNAPDTYTIRGMDASHYNGDIDWSLLKEAGISFTYVKATESVGFTDPQFKANWQGAKANGIAAGAYHVFDFCKDPDQQLAHIKAVIPKDEGMLPISVDLEWYDKPTNPKQASCANVDAAKANISKLLIAIRANYGLSPVIHASASGLRDLRTDLWNEFPLWLQYFKKSPSFDENRPYTEDGPRMPGDSPWTIWQVSSTGRLPGVKVPIDVDVFFGASQQFEQFRTTGGNVALKAANGH